MNVERTEVNKVTFKNCSIQKDENGKLFIVEDLGDKGTQSQSLEEVILEVFGEQFFNMTIQSKMEL